MGGGQVTYLDASALMRRAESSIAGCTARNALIAPVIAGILDDTDRRIVCSEFTLMEFHSNLTVNWRGPEKDFDEAWWHSSRDDVLDRIMDGRIEVLRTPPQILEQAMAIVTVATRDYLEPVRSWDAVHMLVANQFGFANSQSVEIITSDKHFGFVSKYSGFSQYLSVTNLDVAAGTGCGADRGL